MSPEQLAADRQLDGRSDQYALACLVYEMFSGTPPFMGVRGVVDNAKKFITPPDLLSATGAQVSIKVEAAIRRALACNPDDRFKTAGDFAAALEPRGGLLS